MALRLLIVDIPEDLRDVAREAVDEAGAVEAWDSPGGCFGHQVQGVIGADRTGGALDLLHDRIASRGGFRALVLPLHAVLPRPPASPTADDRNERRTAASVSREEVYANVSAGAEQNATFYAMTVLATVVAGIGLTQDNTAAVIGAMVVAPLLGPNMALALGLTLGDGPLVRASLRTSLRGVAVAFLSAVVMGAFMWVDPQVAEIASRTRVGVGDMVLAVAAGAAGTLAYTTGAPTYLVGVMVAVALLPPTVASGLLLGHGHWQDAAQAGLLVAVNTVAVVFSAMVTLLVSGMRPRAWWKEERAKKSSRIASVVLGALLVALLGLVFLSRSFS